MRNVIADAPTAGNKARAGLSKEESARFFGPPPLVAGEDPAQYEAIRTQILAAVQPLDILEEISVNDIVNLVWETRRLRRLMVNLLNEDNGKFLTKLLALRIERSSASIALSPGLKRVATSPCGRSTGIVRPSRRLRGKRRTRSRMLNSGKSRPI
jgi:hypothetical protein